MDVSAADLAERNLAMANFSELILEDPLHEREPRSYTAT
jgi:hypothetical protein